MAHVHRRAPRGNAASAVVFHPHGPFVNSKTSREFSKNNNSIATPLLILYLWLPQRRRAHRVILAIVFRDEPIMSPNRTLSHKNPAGDERNPRYILHLQKVRTTSKLSSTTRNSSSSLAIFIIGHVPNISRAHEI